MNVSGAHPSSPKFKTVTFCSNVDAGPDVITFYTYPETTPTTHKILNVRQKVASTSIRKLSFRKSNSSKNRRSGNEIS